jgi:UDP-3-O-[3-hydroxymyristoyl] glucosamine N-acyltransferase
MVVLLPTICTSQTEGVTVATIDRTTAQNEQETSDEIAALFEPAFDIGDIPNVHHTASVHPTARLGLGTKIGKYADIEEGVVTGEDCIIEDYAHLMAGVILGDKAAVGKGSILEPGVVFGDNSSVKKGSHLEDVVVGFNSHIGSGCNVRHSKIGDNVTIGQGVRLNGDVTVENEVDIDSGATLEPGAIVKYGAEVYAGTTVPKTYVVPRNGYFSKIDGKIWQASHQPN